MDWKDVKVGLPDEEENVLIMNMDGEYAVAIYYGNHEWQLSHFEGAIDEAYLNTGYIKCWAKIELPKND